MRNPLALIRRAQTAERDIEPLTFEDYLTFFTFAGNTYGIPAFTTTMPTSHEDPIAADFAGLTSGAYKRNSIVFACMAARFHLFAEARFQFRRLQSGRPGALFGTTDLAPLEHPWPNGTTGDLLRRAIVDVDLAGNFFAYRKTGTDTVKRIRPDWTTIVLGSPYTTVYVPGDPDLEVVGYIYKPGGSSSDADPITMRPDEVAHFAPIPDPQASFRGMSWLTPLIREILSDGAATSHKLKYFENGGTPNIAVILPQMKPEAFDAFVTKFRDQHEGVSNAYRALFLAGGADVKTVGSDLKQIDFKVTQGAGETRIAAAAGVPPVIVGLSEGLAASTYSNYTQARRRFADGTIRPLWRDFCGSMSAIITVPPSAELWYDDRDIPFVQEDEKDAAEVLQFEAAAIASLVTSGYTADSVVAAVTARDLNLLQHSGLFSVQLQPAGSGNTPAPTANGAAASGREIVAAALNR